MSIFKHIGKYTTAMANLAIGCCAILLGSCNSDNENRFADMTITSDSSDVTPYSIIRFDKEVMTIKPNEVEECLTKLLDKYGDLFDMYLRDGIEVGSAYSKDETTGKRTINAKTAETIKTEVLSNLGYQTFFQAEDSVFADGLDKEMLELTDAMRRFHYFFPKQKLPKTVIAMFSCFGPKMAVGVNDELMVSMEYYIGSNFEKYKFVDGIYAYDAINLSRDMMVRDLVLGWSYYSFPDPRESNCRLLDEMLYQGKLMYIMESCLPKTEKHKLMGYTKKQWMWSVDNEKRMWESVKEKKHLYTFDRMTISKYINPAPHTVFFPYDVTVDDTPEAPGKGGIWLGWRIVSSYMKNNPSATLEDLIALTDSQVLLENSGYNPK